MEFIKSKDRVDAISEDGALIGYIKKNYIGTHGHSSGWEHFVYSDKLDKFVYAGAIQVEHLGHPWVFRNVKDFKTYYGGI